MKPRAWFVSWLVVGLLGITWYGLIEVAPTCRLFGDCAWWSDFAIFVFGIPVMGVAVFVALCVSFLAWWRR